MRSRHRSRLMIAQAVRQRDGDVCIADDEGGPAPVPGEAADSVTDVVAGDVGTDRGDHADEVHTQLGSTLVDAGVASQGDEHIGEVHAGCRDRDLDLSRTRRDPVECGEFHRLQVAGSPDTQAHNVVRVIDDRGAPLVGTQRTRAQPRCVPLPTAPGCLVFIRAAEQFLRHVLAVGVFVDIDLGDAEMWILGADHPQQTTQSRLRQVVFGLCSDDLRLPGHDKQARGLPGEFCQLARDAHQMPNLLAAFGQAVLVGGAIPRRPYHGHAREFVLAEIVREPFGFDPMIGLRGPRQRDDVLITQFQGVDQLLRQQV